jgi:hypothetical protein
VNNSPLRLYVDSQFSSPYAMSAFVVLREKGIEFEMIPLDLEASENRGLCQPLADPAGTHTCARRLCLI